MTLARLLQAACVVLALVMCGCSPACAGGGNLPGQYELRRMLKFYVVNPNNANFSASIRWINYYQDRMDTPVLVRVFNPNEQLVARHLEPGSRISGSPVWTIFNVPVTASGAGVYEVVVTGFDGLVEIHVTPDLRWGVYGYPELAGQHQFATTYFYLPPNLPTLSLQTTGDFSHLRIYDHTGALRANLSGMNPSTTIVLPAGSDLVWRLEAASPQRVSLRFGVAPIILCPDAATAMTIRSGVDVLADGTVCYHKFQVTAHSLLAQYRAMDASAFAVTPPALGSYLSAWQADPARSSLLLGPYGMYSALPAALQSQNLNPSSHWFGTMQVWRDPNGGERPQNPWTTYDRLNLSEVAQPVNALAAVYAINEAFNPLYHSPQLRNRVIIATLQQMMMVREHELPQTAWTNYDGGDKAFAFARLARSYPWVVQDCPSEVRDVWTAGLGRYADQMVVSQVAYIVNQWSSIIFGMQCYAMGCQIPFYSDAVSRHINWLLTRKHLDRGFMPAGYFTDGEGPDATYQGISAHYLAWVAEASGHTALKAAVGDAFYLMSHTIAPEPTGEWLGASSFSYRTPDTWVGPQWGAGVGIAADDFGEASVMLGRVWIPWRPPRNNAELQYLQQQIAFNLQYLPADTCNNPLGLSEIVDGSMIHMSVWEHYQPDEVVTGQLPMKASNTFTRKFGNEFMAVRRPSYYAVLYTGKTFDEVHEPGAPDNPSVQYPRNGGGLSMLWSPRVGTSILAKNWSAYATNGLIARNGSNYPFEDYWTVTSSLQPAQNRATTNGRLTDNKMRFERKIEFLPDRILGQLRLQSVGSVTYDKLWECFPFPLDKPDSILVTLHAANGDIINGNNKVASAIALRAGNKDVHVFAFKQPRRCNIGSHVSTDAYGGQREIGRVLTELPRQWNSNQVRTVKWSMKVCKVNQVHTTIQQLMQSMQ